MDVTKYIAIYGAVLSTAAIFWNIWKDLKDKPNVKVSASIGVITFRMGLKPRSMYIFSAVNKSKRPVTLTSTGIRIEKDQNCIFLKNTNLPKKLMEGDKINFYRTPEEFYPEVKNHDLKYLWFKDTTGKEYKSKSIKKLFSVDHREKND